jgi:hypothetical protein
MLKTLTVLAQILRREEFTIKELADEAAVPASTVTSVMRRMPSDWFTQSKIASKNRGGQRLLYTLTATGRQGVLEKLNRLPEIARSAPAQPAFDAPMGLLAAEETLEEIETFPQPLRDGLLEDVRDNLDWADAEIQGGSYSQSAGSLAARIAAARQKAESPLQVLKSAQVMLPAGQEGVLQLARKKLDAAHRQIRYWKHQIAEACRVLPRVALRESSHSRDHVHVYISYLVSDRGCRELAYNAKWAFAGAAQMSRKRSFDVIVGKFEEGTIKDALQSALAGTSHSGAAEFQLLLLCINSAVDPVSARSAVERLVSLERKSFVMRACVLDRGNSPLVAKVLHDRRLTYSPNAADGSSTDWLGETLG